MPITNKMFRSGIVYGMLDAVVVVLCYLILFLGLINVGSFIQIERINRLKDSLWYIEQVHKSICSNSNTCSKNIDDVERGEITRSYKLVLKQNPSGCIFCFWDTFDSEFKLLEWNWIPKEPPCLNSTWYPLFTEVAIFTYAMLCWGCPFCLVPQLSSALGI